MARGNKHAVRKNPVDGKAGEASAPAQELIVDNGSLRRLYGLVLKCRMAAERVPRWSGLGATAQAAAAVELKAEDAIVVSGESLPLQLLEGATLASALGANGSGAMSQPNGAGPKIVPQTGAGKSQLTVAAGVALAYKFAGTGAVVVALWDAASMAVGAAYEALDYIAAHTLPMVVVVENMAAEAQRPDLTLRAQVHALPAFVVDGNDAVAVYRVAREAIHRARGGRGPSLLDCRNFAMTEDPLRHLERYLEKHGLWTAQAKQEITAEAERELRRARRNGRAR